MGKPRSLLLAIIIIFLVAGLWSLTHRTSTAPAPEIPQITEPSRAISPSTPPSSEQALNEKVLNIRLPGEPETLDWNLAHTNVETYLLMSLGEGLMRFDSTGLDVVPALASQFTRSPDGKVYRFRLRSGLKWSDGVELKIDDFVTSWRRLLSPLTSASYAYLLFDVEGAEDFHKGIESDFEKVGIKKIDESTLQITLKKPVQHWIYLPAFWPLFPLRQDIVDLHGTGWPKPGRMVTVGPYVLSEALAGDKYVLRKNPHYWDSTGNVDVIQAKIIADDTKAIEAYERGELDMLTDFSSQDLAKWIGRPDLKRFPYLKVGYVGFQQARFPVNNTHFRRAIALSLDKSGLRSVMLSGQSAARSFIPQRLMGYSERLGLEFNRQEAHRELRLAGVDLLNPPKIDLLTISNNKDQAIANWIKDQVRAHLGLEIQVDSLDHKEFRAQLDLSSHGLFTGSWGADYPDSDNFLSIFLSNSGNNRFGWKNKTYDDLVIKARHELNRREREKFYLEAQKILLEKEAVVIPLYYEPIVALIKAHVQGVEINPMNYLFLRKVTVSRPIF